jgi:hypothetical protein
MSETNWTFSQNFYADFQASRSSLEARIDAAASKIKSQSNSEPPLGNDELQQCTVELAKLTKSLGDATGSLPGYDQRQCESQLKAIEKTLEDLRISVAPKTKFAFKRKVKGPFTSPPPSVPLPSKSEESVGLPRDLNLGSLPVSATASGESHSDLTLQDLDGCIVNLSTSGSGSLSGADAGQLSVSAVHVRNVTNTVLFLPVDVRGSVILHGLVRCVVVVGCHQFRMHSSRDVDVYLSIPSNPIIEHSSRIRFTAYPESLLSTSSSPVKEGESKHTSVQDFSHIRTTTPSPNWSVMRDEDRVRDWSVLTESGDSVEEVGKVLDGVLPCH